MKYIIKHPRKILWTMRDFINDANDLTYEAWYLRRDKEFEISCEDDFTTWFEKNFEVKNEKRKVKLVSMGTFCAFSNDDIDEEYFRIGYDLDDIAANSHGGDKDFSADFYKRCPLGRGFANITLTLLHELGHICTNEEVREYWSREQRKEQLKSERGKI